MLLWHYSTQSDFWQRQLGELSDHELKPILVKVSKGSYRTPFLDKCYFEQKEGAPHEVYVPYILFVLYTLGSHAFRGCTALNLSLLPWEIIGFQITNRIQHGYSLISHENYKDLPEIRANWRIRKPTLNTHITVYFADSKTMLKVKVLSEESHRGSIPTSVIFNLWNVISCLPI